MWEQALGIEAEGRFAVNTSTLGSKNFLDELSQIPIREVS
jgi:hypothetical protein